MTASSGTLITPRVVLVERNPPATPEALAFIESVYPEPCDHRCWHSSCWSIRDLRERVARA